MKTQSLSQPVLHPINQDNSTQTLSSAQKKFNAVLARLEKQQAELAAWQQTHLHCQNEAFGKYEPLRRDYIAERIKLACVLDAQLTHHKFSKQQTGKLTDIITQLCHELMAHSDDPELATLCQRYQSTPSSEEIQDFEQMRAQMAELFGDATFDPDHFADDFMAQQHQQHRAHSKNKPHNSTSKQQAAAEETNQAQQSLQQLYRQLVASLHPDREPDANERERKTQLMQTVTVAYEQKDLFKLLTLQLAETHNAQALDTLADTQLKNYIRLLEQQIQQCQAEVDDIQTRYKAMLGIAPYHQLTPKRLTQLLKEDTRHLNEQLKQTKSDRLAFERDVDYLKAWLKYYPIASYDD